MASPKHVPRWTPTESPSRSPSPLLSSKEKDSSFAYHDQEEDGSMKNIFPFSTTSIHHDNKGGHSYLEEDMYDAPSLRIEYDHQPEVGTRGGSVVMEMEPIEFMTDQLQQQQDKGSREAVVFTREGVVLTWEDLCVSVPSSSSKGNHKAIVEGLNGYAQPGEVLGIMGPSGSGKSTLLDALAGNYPN
ncbi:hypothetical protein MKW92_010301 [Papaver armeniacum]|nr:hypothetical protein MKW92_010301 [Papaver armeniacum]